MKKRDYQLSDVVLLILVLFIVLSWIFNSIRRYGTEVVITPVESIGDTIIFRGASIDGDWYAPKTLCLDSDWSYDAGEQTYTSKGNYVPLKLRIPAAESVSLVFNCGPDQGKVQVQAGKTTEVWDFYNENVYENGQLFALHRSDNGLNGSLILLTLCVAVVFSAFVYYIIKGNMIRLPRMGRFTQKSKPIIERVFVCLLLPAAFVFVLYFSISASPRIPAILDYYGHDSAIYRVVGRGWFQGLIPYRDLFEQKGPIVFLVYAFAEWISLRYGLFILEVFTLFISSFLCYLIAREIAGTRAAICGTLIMLVYLMAVFGDGATVGEFNLPCLMLSTYMIVKYYNRIDITIEHPPIYAFVHGCTFAVSLGMRVTNSLALCCFVFSIVLLLFFKKKYKNLFINAVSFSGGGVVLIRSLYTLQPITLWESR